LRRRRKTLVNPLEEFRLLPTDTNPKNSSDTTSEPEPGTTTPAAANDYTPPSTVILVDQISEVQVEDQAMFEHDTQMNDHTPDPVPHIFQPQAAAPTSGSGHPLRKFEVDPGPGIEVPYFDFYLDLLAKCWSRSSSRHLQVQS